MSEVLEDRNLALDLVKEIHPVIDQAIESIYDFPTAVRIDPSKEIEMIAYHIALPPLYFQVREDDDFTYLYFMVYHSRDWSNNGVAFLRKLDSHLHDTESILIRRHKRTSKLGICAVAHYNFSYKRIHSPRPKVFIEARSHAIRLEPFGLIGAHARYLNYDFVDLQSIKEETFNKWREAFKGQASMPDQQFDSRMDDGNFRLHFKPGDIYLRPERVFEFADRRKLWIS